MPSTKNYRELHDQVMARPGAVERLAALREDTLAEIGLSTNCAAPSNAHGQTKATESRCRR